jgi:hypothetical protein
MLGVESDRKLGATLYAAMIDRRLAVQVWLLRILTGKSDYISMGIHYSDEFQDTIQ